MVACNNNDVVFTRRQFAELWCVDRFSHRIFDQLFLLFIGLEVVDL